MKLGADVVVADVMARLEIADLADRPLRTYSGGMRRRLDLGAALMVEPGSLAGGDHQIFLSGNDAGAKEKASEILKSFGWKNILDLGDITTARGAEMLLPLWLRLYAALGTPNFNIKVVRAVE